VCAAVGVTNQINVSQLTAFSSSRQLVQYVDSFANLAFATDFTINAIASACNRASVQTTRK
jgi:hypothetical protein